MTEKELAEVLKKGHCKIATTGNPPIFKEVQIKSWGKVMATKTEIDGHLFDSKSEALIYSEFKIDPDVKILELQPIFLLLSGFRRKNKSIIGITYKADFTVELCGHVTVVEVKSKGTLRANSKSYPMRRKLFLKKYPKFNFREIIFNGKSRTVKDY